ncbi:MAG: DUF5335 domain-containing protein [Acidobacteria bacterium]|nr:DUF5335 domain-containing protein [Acidobacteriota bacterium]
MTRTQEIEKHQWVSFLDNFSREHEGWRVNIEVEDPSMGSQVQSQDMPLQGISADIKRAGEQDISIIVGREHNPALTHIILRATHLWLMQTEGGTEEALQIESAGGETTILRFRAAMRSETVNR